MLIGPTGLLHASWYYNFPQGIALIYVYFQIPLMVLVFMPAIGGLKSSGGRRPRASVRQRGNVNAGAALARGMVIMVIIVMSLYALLQQRAARWPR